MHDLRKRTTPGASVTGSEQSIQRLTIPAGLEDVYRWAQLDDYLHIPRSSFRWQPPLRLEVSARVSAQTFVGTWGFGLWNDPFNASLGIGGSSRRLPALPNAAWFFFASPQNYLSFRSDQPANGLLAAVFSSPRIHSLLLSPGILALPFLFSRHTMPLLRRSLRLLISEEARDLHADWTAWHEYAFNWFPDRVVFELDGKQVFQTNVSPRGQLGLVIWLDNQYASFAPGSRFRSGKLTTESESWLEIRGLTMG